LLGDIVSSPIEDLAQMARNQASRIAKQHIASETLKVILEIRGGINAGKEISTFILLIAWSIWGREWLPALVPIIYFLNLWAWNIFEKIALGGIKCPGS